MTQRDISETPEQLFERIQPAFDAVDLDNLSDAVLNAVYMTEISGTPASDDFKRLIALKKDDVIDSEETRMLIIYLFNKRHAA